MMGIYLNQTVTLKTKTTVNEYNESSYTTASVKARFEYKRRLLRDASGEEIMCLAIVYLNSYVKPDDLISFDNRDWTVKTVSNYYGLMGNLIGYEVGLI